MDRNTKKLIATLRQEFSFYANDEDLNTILRKIAAEGVTIIAFTITKVNGGRINFVRLVVGPENSNSSRANMVLADVLREIGIRYHQKEVIQLIVVIPAPGILSSILDALYHHVIVFAAYTGDNSAILDVSDIQTALKFLKKNNVIG